MDGRKMAEGKNPLSKQELGRMIHMVIGKRCHSVIAMVVVGLVSDLDALHAVLGCRLFEILGKELALLVEVVAGSLVIINTCPICICIQDSICIWS